MGTTQERIIVTAEFYDKTAGTSKRLKENLRKLEETITSVGKKYRTSSTYVTKYDKFGNELGKTLTKRVRKPLNDAAKSVDKLNKAYRSQIMALLGVMFFTQALTNTIEGLFKPAMEAFGVMDLWQDMLTVLFLPVMDMLIPYFIDFVNWIMNLPDPVKTAIGQTLAFVGILSALIGIFASVGITMIGLGALFPAFAGRMAAAGGAAGLFKVTMSTLFSGLLLAVATGAVFYVFDLLEERFGTSTNAAKAWAASFILFLTTMAQALVDVLLSPLTAVLWLIKKAIEGYNSMAVLFGKDPISTDWFDDAIKNINTGLLVGTSIYLDKIGYNPQAVNGKDIVGSPLYNAAHNISSEPNMSVAPTGLNTNTGLQTQIANLDAQKQYGGLTNADLINTSTAGQKIQQAQVNYNIYASGVISTEDLMRRLELMQKQATQTQNRYTSSI